MRSAIVMLALLLAACSSSTATGPTGRRQPTTVTVGWSDKGHSLTVRQGDIVQVRLQSTYWQFRPVAGGVVSRGTVMTRASHGPMPVPGSGRGTVIATYRALKSGTAHVTAARTSCGEALRCSSAQSSFSLTVVVG